MNEPQKSDQIYHRQLIAWIKGQKARIALMESEIRKNKEEIEHRKKIIAADTSLLKSDKQALEGQLQELKAFKKRIK